MLKFAILAFCIFEIAAAITKDDCPRNLSRGKYMQVFGDKCYYFFLQRKLDYSDAADICFTEGGILATVKSQEVNQFLHTQLDYTYSYLKGTKRVWIGLSDLEKEGTFKWSDGSAMKYENFNTLEGPHASFLHVTRLVEDCVAMDQTTGKWADYKCESGYFLFDEHRPFICEFKSEIHTTTTTTTTTTRAPFVTTQTNITVNGSVSAN